MRTLFHLRLALLLSALLVLVACGAEQAPAVSTAVPAAAQPDAPSTAAPEATTAPTSAPAANITRTKGDPSAPVKVIEYSDFQWPYCASFVRETLPQIEETYIDTGKVYFEYRDFPLSQIHGSAVLASHAANCAATQDAYFPMHDRLFAGQEASEWGSNLSEDFGVFLEYARELEIDDARLQSCVQSQQFASLIENDYRAGLEAGVQSTPTFVVNGEVLVGAQPFEVWKQVIDTALEAVGTQP